VLGIAVDVEKVFQFKIASPTDNAQDLCTFYFHEGKWTVGFAGKENQFKDSAGLKYLHLLLPRDPIAVSNLISITNWDGTDQGSKKTQEYDFHEGGRFDGLKVMTEAKGVRVTKDTHTLIRNELQVLKDEVESLRAAGDHEGSAEMEARVEKIERELKKGHFKGFELPYCSQYKRDLDSVRIAVNRAIKSIGTVNAELAWHLTVSIKFGAHCVYRPEKLIHWKLSQSDGQNVAPVTMDAKASPPQ
jgi:hypothetical protein